MIQDKMEYELKLVEKKTHELARSLEDQVSKIALTYTTIEHPEVKPEMVINGSGDVKAEIRDKVLNNCRL